MHAVRSGLLCLELPLHLLPHIGTLFRHLSHEGSDLLLRSRLWWSHSRHHVRRCLQRLTKTGQGGAAKAPFQGLAFAPCLADPPSSLVPASPSSSQPSWKGQWIAPNHPRCHHPQIKVLPAKETKEQCHRVEPPPLSLVPLPAMAFGRYDVRQCPPSSAQTSPSQPPALHETTTSNALPSVLAWALPALPLPLLWVQVPVQALAPPPVSYHQLLASPPLWPRDTVMLLLGLPWEPPSVLVPPVLTWLWPFPSKLQKNSDLYKGLKIPFVALTASKYCSTHRIIPIMAIHDSE